MRRLTTLPARTVVLIAAICIGSFVDSAIFILLLLSSSALDVTWWVTAVILANLIPPILFAPFLGSIVDRTSGRGAWVWALLISAVCAAGISLFDSPVALVGLAAAQSICFVVLSASVFKLLPYSPSMDERLASSFAVGIGSIAAIGAPPLAAFVATLGIDVAFWICAGGLVIAALFVAYAAPRDIHVHVDSMRWHEVWLGTRTVRSLGPLKAFAPAILGVVLVTSMEGVAGVFYLQEVAGNAVGYALLLSAWAVGSLCGAILSGHKRFRVSAVVSVLAGGFVVSLAILLEGVFFSAIVIGVVFLAGGIGNAIHNVGVRNFVYDVVPKSQQAQVWSMVGAVFSGSAALGNALGTPGLLGPARTVIVVAGATGVVLVLVTVLIRLARARRAEAASQAV